MKEVLAICMVAISCVQAGAQPNDSTFFQVSGRVEDTAGSALGEATVQLIMGADSLTELSRTNGRFVFNRVRSRKFSLSITMKGYLPLRRQYALQEGKTAYRLDPVVLHPDFNELEPAIVTGVRPVEIRGDTVSYSTSAFPVREGSEVEEILRRLPGVEVDLDGNIIVQGKKVTKVTVNGKEFFGGDVLLAIQNLPADMVSKLQVIDDYGDQARLTGIKVDDPAKVLNIVLKPDRRSGVFGHVEAGAGNDSKFAEEGFGNAFQGDRQLSAKADAKDENPVGRDPNETLALSYADLWSARWRAAFTASGGADDSRSNGGMTQNTFYPGDQTNLQQTTSSASHDNHYDLGGILNFNSTTTSALRITPTYGNHTGNSQSLTDFTSVEQDSGFTKTINGITAAHGNSRGWHAGNDFYFEHTIPNSKQRYSLEATVSYTDGEDYVDNLSTSSILANNIPSQSVLQYLLMNSSSNLAMDFQSTYYYPIGTGKFLEAGYHVQSEQSRSDQVTQTPDSLTGIPTTIDSLSLKEFYSTMTQQLHGGCEAVYGKLTLATAVDGEWGRLSGIADGKGDRYIYPYFAPQPRLRLNWRFNRSHALSFQYQGSSIIPSLQQVIPITNISNPQYPVTGNPNLRPSFPQTATVVYENSSLHAIQYSGFGVSVGVSMISDPVVTVITHPQDRSQVIQRTTYLNSGRSVSYSLGYHFTLPAFFAKLFRLTGNGSMAQTESPVITDGSAYTNRNQTLNQALHLQVSIAKKMDLDLQGNYSITHTSFPGSSQPPSVLQTAGWQIGGRNIFLCHWMFGYRFNQSYQNSANGLRPSPATLTAFIHRDFLRHNQANISIAGFNLLNSAAATAQTVTPTSITQSQTNFIGRFFLAKIILKLQRFHG